MSEKMGFLNLDVRRGVIIVLCGKAYLPAWDLELLILSAPGSSISTTLGGEDCDLECPHRLMHGHGHIQVKHTVRYNDSKFQGALLLS